MASYAVPISTTMPTSSLAEVMVAGISEVGVFVICRVVSSDAIVVVVAVVANDDGDDDGDDGDGDGSDDDGDDEEG